MSGKVVDDRAAATAGNVGRKLEGAVPDLGASRTPPSRERTILGVAVPVQVELPVAPIVVPPPAGEKTMLGVGIPTSAEPTGVPSPSSDPSIPIDLSVRKVQSEPSLVPAGLPRRRGATWVLLLVLTTAAALGYVRREQLRPLLVESWHRVMEQLAPRR